MSVYMSGFANVYYKIITNMSNFHPLQVVGGRGSETQLVM